MSSPVIPGTDGRGRSLAQGGGPAWGDVRITDIATGASYVAWCPLATRTEADRCLYLLACGTRDAVEMGGKRARREVV